MKKIILSLFLFVLACFCFNINTYAYENVDASLKIYDNGEYLTEEEEKILKEKIDDFTDKYKLDLVILTERNYLENAMQAYAEDFYDYNDFGVGETKDGILLFYTTDSIGPIVWITTTGEGMRMYDDSRIDGLMSSMSSVKSNGDYAIIEKFITECDDYASTGAPLSTKLSYIDSKGDLHVYPLILILIISLVITIIVIAVLVNKNKMVKKATFAGDYLDKSSLSIPTRSDRFISTHTSKVKIETSSGGGSGGSSGRSHGGGGGRL